MFVFSPKVAFLIKILLLLFWGITPQIDSNRNKVELSMCKTSKKFLKVTGRRKQSQKTRKLRKEMESRWKPAKEGKVMGSG